MGSDITMPKALRITICVLPLAVLLLGIVNLVLLLSSIARGSFFAWVFAGSFTECVSGVGMLAAYYAMYRIEPMASSINTSLISSCATIPFITLLIVVDVQAGLAEPAPSNSVTQGISYSLLVFVGALILYWSYFVSRKYRISR
jgi:uncharacterized membrane-anchored protein